MYCWDTVYDWESRISSVCVEDFISQGGDWLFGILHAQG